MYVQTHNLQPAPQLFTLLIFPVQYWLYIYFRINRNTTGIYVGKKYIIIYIYTVIYLFIYLSIYIYHWGRTPLKHIILFVGYHIMRRICSFPCVIRTGRAHAVLYVHRERPKQVVNDRHSYDIKRGAGRGGGGVLWGHEVHRRNGCALWIMKMVILIRIINHSVKYITELWYKNEK